MTKELSQEALELLGSLDDKKTNGKGKGNKTVADLFGNGEEEKVIEIKRNGAVTGVSVLGKWKVNQVTYDEIKLEYADSRSKFLYDVTLIARDRGYYIPCEVYSQRMAEFGRYEIKKLEIKKGLLDIIAEVMPHLVEGFKLDVFVAIG